MTGRDIISEKIHSRHDPKWSWRLWAPEGNGSLLCVACAFEIIGDKDVSSVRKSFALSSLSGVLTSSPGTLRRLLQQDHRVSAHFTVTLLRMLQTTEDPVTLEKVDQVLVQLLLELQSETIFRFVLDEINKKLTDQLNLKHFLATFNFLGNLVKAVPHVAPSLVTHVTLLDCLCSALLYPDEALKTSIVYVWLQLTSTPGSSLVQSLPLAIRDRVCNLLLLTLAHANSLQLIRNCVGLLLQLVQLAEAVSVLMNSPVSQIMCDESEEILRNNSQSLSQNQEQQPSDHCPLPLILKKLLLSGDETLQVTSVKCIASVLVHSPSQYSNPFIKADVPEFLFDRLACSSNDVLLWSLYSCLLLLTEDPLFFSQCHSVYGIESLVRSLKEALQLTNLEVPKQGFLLLTKILERQPPSVRLFPSRQGFSAVSEAIGAGVLSSCLLVAMQSTSAAAALFRLNHQSVPVQCKEIEGLIEAITSRFPELTLPPHAHLHSSRRTKWLDPSGQATKSEGYVLQALACFQAACRLAEECASEPVLRENTFTSPYKQSTTQDSLESLCQCLFRCCDSIWIPTFTRTHEYVPSIQILEHFYTILSSQFTLCPSLMPAFANKLASSGFYRQCMEHKGRLCAGNRNPNLNAACCDFLQKLSVCLLSQSDYPSGSHQHDVKEVENLLKHALPSLCCPVSNWRSLLYECQGPRATQYCVVIILHLALQHGDRLLPDMMVFCSVLWLLHSVQEQGNCALPHSVLRSALYLLAVAQDSSPSVSGVPLNCIYKALSSCQSFSSLYFHHTQLLHFICRYPELAEKFGPQVLELWLMKKATDAGKCMAEIQEKGENQQSTADEKREHEPDTETTELLTLIEKYPAVILTLLDIVCTKEASLAQRALAVFKQLLHSQRDFKTDLCENLRPALLQALQRFNMENMGHGQEQAAQVNSLPLVLKLLCVMQASDPPSSSHYSNMEGEHFKLLYHVTNIAGRLKPTNTESLLPAINYLYCYLSLCPVDCTDRAVSMLLSSSGLMGQLQTVFSSSAPSLSSSACPPLALLCCCHLLLSSLITLQRIHSAQVNKCITWSLDEAVQCILVRKRKTDNLLLVSSLRMLQVLLDADLESAVVILTTGPGLVGCRLLGVQDGALYPLGFRGAKCLSTALAELFLQKHELLLRASVNCLSSLLGFLQRKSPATAKEVVCQPGSRFLLQCLLSSGESCLLYPAILQLITLLLQAGGTAVLWEADLLQVMEMVESKGVKDLSKEAAQALRQLLTLVQSKHFLNTEEHKQRVENMMGALEPQTEAESRSLSSALHLGDVSVCLSDFTLKTD
ncbi:meiosis inhibitor protein 1 [Pholidichthys leucotaenia]